MSTGTALIRKSRGMTRQRAIAIVAACLAIFSLGGLLVACGSSQADKSAPALQPDETEPRQAAIQPSKGQFIDSAVSGLFYQTETLEGFTDHNGQFEYVEGETVAFSIGNIALGSTTGKAIITPIDLTSGKGLDDTSVNILRLLQTLDYDGDPGNGISIATNTHLAASQLPDSAILINSDIDSFAANTSLLDLISRVTNLAELIPAETAIRHFQQTTQQLQLAEGS